MIKAIPKDDFGFDLEAKVAQATSPQDNEKKLMRDNARTEKWRKMLPGINQMILTKDVKLKKRIRKGIPDSFRTKVWPLLIEAPRLKLQHPHVKFSEIITRTDIPAVEEIDRDIGRTFPEHYFFKEKNGPGQIALRNVLLGIAALNPQLGYCQGINFLVGMLVMYCNDEDAFWIMNSILYTFKLEDYYISPKLLSKPMYILEQLIKSKLPSVSKALEKLHINPLYYATKWFISLYTDVLPFNCVVRMIDCLLFERNKIIYRVALAILKVKSKGIIKAQTMEDMMAQFKDYKEPIFFDDDKFMKIAFKFSLSRKEIRKWENKFFVMHKE